MSDSVLESALELENSICIALIVRERPHSGQNLASSCAILAPQLGQDLDNDLPAIF